MSMVNDLKQTVQGAMQGVMAKAAQVAPGTWLPGGKPDILIEQRYGLVGAPVSRLDGPLKVRGKAAFAAEFPMDNMVYAALAFSTIAKGRIATLDTTTAEAAEGVVLVMTYRNAPRMARPPALMTSDKAGAGDDLPVMQDECIHWNGQPIAVVLAETQEQADYAKSLIHVTYNVETATTSFAQARENGTEPGTFMGPLLTEIGDADVALAAAAIKVDQVYRTPRQNHNALELHAATLAWEGDKLLVHDSSQGVTLVAWSLSRIFGIKENEVQVTSPYVGGGFGGKFLWQHQTLAAAAAKLAKRPVRITLSREGVYRVVGGRTVTEQRVAIGADLDGHFKAVIQTGTVAMTRHNALPEPFISSARHAYAAETFKLKVEVAYMDMLANTFMRAPGEAVGTFALESAVDELAVALGIDPVELRARNEPEKDPTSGLPFASRNIVEAFRQGAERFGWSKRQATPGTFREGDWLVGMGCASGSYPYSRAPGGAARITLTQAGFATIHVAAHEMGMGTATVHTQVSAARLGLELDQVTFILGDSTLPGNVMAAGSGQTAVIGGSVMAAQQALVTELLKLLHKDSPLAGLKAEQVIGLNGGLAKADEPERHETYSSILTRAGKDEITVETDAPPPLESMHWCMYSHCAQFCEVGVHVATGETRIRRFLGSFDCGRILNAKTAASQFRGSIIMGLGLALMEETQFDERNGRIMNPSLAEYHIPVHMDIPELDVIWTDIPDPHAPMGAHGVGEIGVTGVGAAVANAIFNATGKRIRDLPITLDKLM